MENHAPAQPGGKPQIVIQTDVRETASGIPLILEQYHEIKVFLETLKTGDYLINKRIIVERKTAMDFAQSLIDGRLFKQAAMLKKSFDHTLMIVEGDIISIPDIIDIHPHAIAGALISLGLAWRMHVLFSKNTEETALLLWLIGNQNIKPLGELSFRPGRRPKRLYKRQLYILQGLPGIGPKSAMKLLAHFKSVAAVMTASEPQLMNVSGLGKKKACKIKEVLTLQGNMEA